jgi:NADPH-dependent 2,4-dienoyl-CoA reductase/sulfur reductase-like enzyme/rhodanese-related sulfurtransferase
MNSGDMANPEGTNIVIIGGVAGGASAAARARRCNATARITILEKGPDISFANCGLPYHLGGEIQQRSKLLVATRELFWNRFRIDVRTGTEAIRIDRQKKEIEVRSATGEPLPSIPYDRLVLATGAQPRRPAFWRDAPNLLHLWTLEDLDRILAWIQAGKVQRVAVVGAGFVGLEVVEQLSRLGIQVDLIENAPQVLAPIDPCFAKAIESHLIDHQVGVHLGSAVQSLVPTAGPIERVVLQDGQELQADLVLVGAGVQPRIELATEAGLTLGPSGGVAVNRFGQTSDPLIYAVGDMAESLHAVTGRPVRAGLAGPANRAGRIAGQHAATGASTQQGEVLGTAIVRVFDLTVGCTGLNQRQLKAEGIPYRSVLIQSAHHASYYPGAKPLEVELLYAPQTGKLLGAQALGEQGVDKRIDIAATTLHFGGTIYDLAQLDIAYAPPFGSAKDPIHMAAFAACNDLAGAPHLVPADADLSGDLQVVDVRTEQERAALPLQGAIGIPIDSLHDRWMELNPQRPTVVVCHSGKRAHVGACLLQGVGFSDVRNLNGGMSLRSRVIAKTPPTQVAQSTVVPPSGRVS